MGERNFQHNLKKMWKTFPLASIIISMSLMNLSPPDRIEKLSTTDCKQPNLNKMIAFS